MLNFINLYEFTALGNFEVTILNHLIDIKTELQRVSAQVSALAAGGPSREDCEDKFQLPINTEEQLAEIESKLDDKEARKSFVSNNHLFSVFIFCITDLFAKFYLNSSIKLNELVDWIYKIHQSEFWTKFSVR